MNPPDQSVLAAQFQECLEGLPQMIGYSLVPAIFVLMLFCVRRVFPVHWLVAISILNVTFLVLALAFFAWTGRPLVIDGTGWTNVLLYGFLWFSTLGLSIAALAAMAFERRRRLLISALAGLASFSIPYFVYPLAVAAWCDRANQHSTDTWRWVHYGGGVIYLIDPRRGRDSQYAGQIELFAPYFSLP
ncbi:MAG: hypothetical protein ACO1TE_11845 [Prosthecobacter sp.]